MGHKGSLYKHTLLNTSSLLALITVLLHLLSTVTTILFFSRHLFSLFATAAISRDPNVPDRRQQEDSGTEKLKTQGTRHYH